MVQQVNQGPAKHGVFVALTLDPDVLTVRKLALIKFRNMIS